jgi:stage II sporulation protein AA (anti-sigma F factor antagonist)
MSHDFSVEIKEAGKPDAKVVVLNGELDEMSIDDLKAELDPHLNDKGLNELIFDLTNLEFINSKGIGYIVSVHTHLTKNKRAMKLAAASEAVMDVISLVGLTTIIPYFKTLEEAQA